MINPDTIVDVMKKHPKVSESDVLKTYEELKKLLIEAQNLGLLIGVDTMTLLMDGSKLKEVMCSKASIRLAYEKEKKLSVKTIVDKIESVENSNGVQAQHEIEGNSDGQETDMSAKNATKFLVIVLNELKSSFGPVMPPTPCTKLPVLIVLGILFSIFIQFPPSPPVSIVYDAAVAKW